MYVQIATISIVKKTKKMLPMEGIQPLIEIQYRWHYKRHTAGPITRSRLHKTQLHTEVVAYSSVQTAVILLENEHNHETSCSSI